MNYSPSCSSVQGFSRQEYCSGLPCPPPGDLPNSGIEPRSPALQEDSLPSKPPGLGFTYCVCVCIYIHTYTHIYIWGFLGGASGKEPAWQCRRQKMCRLDTWVGKIPWRRAYNPLQYSCLENPMDRGARWATVHSFTESWTWLKHLACMAHICKYLKHIYAYMCRYTIYHTYL